jgi:hypothetical protein
MTETIQQLKEDISILQEKLRKLEAQQEPEMTLKKSGDCDMVSYDHKYYYRLSFGVGDYYWYKRYIGSSNLMKVEDPEEHRLVEELYDDTMLDTGGLVLEQGTWNYDPDAKFRKQEEVKKLQEKEWNVDVKTNLKPQTPEQVSDGLKEAFREAIKQGIIPEVDKQENDKNFKSSLDLIREWGEKNKPLNLKELVWEWWEDIFTRNSDLDADASIDILVDMIDKKFIPPSSDRNGYEWEKCLKMMRDKLR